MGWILDNLFFMERVSLDICWGYKFGENSVSNFTSAFLDSAFSQCYPVSSDTPLPHHQHDHTFQSLSSPSYLSPLSSKPTRSICSIRKGGSLEAEMEPPLTLLSERVRLREVPFFFPLTFVAVKLLHDDRTTQRPRKIEREEGRKG